MRLLNVHSEEFHTFLGDDVPNYSIASHRWVQDECSIKDIVKRRNLESTGYKKVHGFCSFVKQANDLYKDTHPELLCDYLWIDTCCIDQKSSLEVDTAIRSMFLWYNKSVVCYAYLADVEPLSTGQDVVEASFRHSVWFSRGWTLQELLAPRTVVFLTRDWEVIGHKCTSTAITSGGECPGAGPRLNGMISEITGIPELVLYDYPRSKELSIEERMSWSAKRKTTRQEDMVYCLLGIFEIHMPVMYGEGEFAQIRLRNEIDKKTEAWQKGQKAGISAHYNTCAPCASSSNTRSHLPTISQCAPQRLPPPVPANNEADLGSVEDSQDTSDPNSARGVNAAQQQNDNTLTPDLRFGRGSKDKTGVDEIHEGIDDLTVEGSDRPTEPDAVPETDAYAGQRMFGPPVRNHTFNTLREPYSRHESISPPARTSVWGLGAGQTITEEEDGQTQRFLGRDMTMVPTIPPSGTANNAPSQPSSDRVYSSDQGLTGPTQDSAANLQHGPTPDDGSNQNIPPPPSYDSVWNSSSNYAPHLAETYHSPAKSPTWYNNKNDLNPKPTRSATWAANNVSAAGLSGSSEWSSPRADYTMPTLGDMRAPTRQATAPSIAGSSIEDINSQLSRKAQRKLESTIAKEERRAKRRERLFNKKHGTASTATGSQRPQSPPDDLTDVDNSEDDDTLSTSETNVNHATNQRAYSLEDTAGLALSPQTQPGTTPRMYGVVQDTRRQDARRRFFENAVIDENPWSGNPSTEVSRPPPPSRTRTNERSLSDIADALPSGLRLTKSALRLLDSRTSGSSASVSSTYNRDMPADQATVVPSEAGTSRSKPMGRKELKEVLKNQRGSGGQDESGKRLGPRDRLLNAVNSHLRGPGS